MKPGLVYPIFGGLDVIDSAKVDEHLKRFAEQINGGLSVENLSPATRFPSTAFAEGSSIFTMTSISSGNTTTGIYPVGVLQSAAKPLGLTMQWNSLPAGQTIRFVLHENGSPRWVSTNYGPIQISTLYQNVGSLLGGWASAYIPIDSVIALAANSLVDIQTLNPSGTAYNSGGMTITLVMSAVHTS